MGVTWATRGFQGSSFIIFKIEKFCQFPTLLLILHELKKLNFNIKKELTLWILKPVILEMELVTRNSKTSTLNSTKSISFMQCPICNGILEDLIWPKIWKIPPVFCIRSCKQALRKLLSQRNENKQFKQKKTLISNSCLIRQSFQGYRCKSCIMIFARRIFWNYAYSPFKLSLSQGFYLINSKI